MNFPEDAVVCAHRAILSFDANGLRSVVSPRDERWAQWLQAWRAFSTGNFGDAYALASNLETNGSAERDPVLVIESAALRALALTALEDFASATSIARRASRMARTESIPDQEFLAHIVLARVRRWTGHPHLATRILSALWRAATDPWRPWLRWELVLSGALEVAFPGSIETGAPLEDISAERNLARLLTAAETGDRPTLSQATADLRKSMNWAPIAREIETSIAICTPYSHSPYPDVSAWREAITNDPPAAVHGLLTRDVRGPSEDTAIAYILATPSEGRRIPRVALRLLDLEDVTVLPQSRRKQGRVESLTAALAVAGSSGLDESDCFHSVYGFPYEPEIHKGPYDVLIHRVRQYVGDAGVVTRSDGRVSLDLIKSILVPDPRCQAPMQDRLLQVVAQHQGATAKEIASTIGVSIRRVQEALSDLASHGACVTSRDGRTVRYSVEDTTFSEPTWHR